MGESERVIMRGSTPMAAQLGLYGCHICNLVTKAEPGGHDTVCSRCGHHLHMRKPDSIARAWAFLIAGYILYVPANVMPIMHTSSLFGAQSDTIMSGVIYLWHSGSWHLALIVFIASILIPSAKLLAMTFLAISVQLGWTERALDRTKLYRVLEFVGP